MDSLSLQRWEPKVPLRMLPLHSSMRRIMSLLGTNFARSSTLISRRVMKHVVSVAHQAWMAALEYVSPVMMTTGSTYRALDRRQHRSVGGDGDGERERENWDWWRTGVRERSRELR